MMYRRFVLPVVIAFCTAQMLVSSASAQVLPNYSLETTVSPQNMSIVLDQQKTITYTVRNTGNELPRASFELVPNPAVRIDKMPSGCKYFIANTTSIVCSIGSMKQHQTASFSFDISRNTSKPQTVSLVGRAYSQVGLLSIRSNAATATVQLNYVVPPSPRPPLPSPVPTPPASSSAYPRPSIIPRPTPVPVVIPTTRPVPVPVRM